MLKPATREAADLLIQGSVCMASLERVGLKIDVPYLDKAIADTKRQIAEMDDEMRGSKEYVLWERHFGDRTKIGSHAQLGTVVFDLMGYKRNPLAVTDSIDLDGTPRASDGEAAFKHVKLPFVKTWFGRMHLDKALGTFLYGIKNETTDGVCHPFFNLYTTMSYRPSSNRPNFQNQPVRNKVMSRIIRQCVVPRKGNVFITLDGQAQEVRSSCFYHKDPTFIKYVLGGGDMHRDTCKDVYLLTDDELGPWDNKGDPGYLPRYAAKNKFVFPGFYGSYYAQMTPDLWDAMDELDLKTAQGVPMEQHLRRKGITSRGACDPNEEPGRGTFEAHVRKCQDLFWKRFPVYDQWKRDWWDLYQRNGGYNTLSGFTAEGIFRRNQVLCNANQGTAFHCFLLYLIEARKQIIRRRMKARCVLQVHDSSMFDCPREEVDDLVPLLKDLYEKYVPSKWPWVSIPLAADFEICETNWFEAKKLKAA